MKRTCAFTEEQLEAVRSKRSRAVSFLKTSVPLAMAPLSPLSPSTSAGAARGPCPSVRAPSPPTMAKCQEVKQWVLTELNQGRELLVYQLAQDFVLDRIVAPMVKAETGYQRFLPAELWDNLVALPGLGFFMELCKMPLDTDLFEELRGVYPDFVSRDLATLIHTDRGRLQFVVIMFWFVTSIFVSKDIQFYWKSDLGFGVKTGLTLSKKSVVNECWGRKVELGAADLKMLQQVNSSVFIVKFMDSESCVVRFFAVFGLLGFLQHACKVCSNVTLFPDQKTRVTPNLADMTEDMLTLCHTLTDLRMGEELFCSIKPATCTSPRHKAVHIAPLVTL